MLVDVPRDARFAVVEYPATFGEAVLSWHRNQADAWRELRRVQSGYPDPCNDVDVAAVVPSDSGYVLSWEF